MSTIKTPRKVKCGFCGKVYPNLQTASEHVVKEHPDKIEDEDITHNNSNVNTKEKSSGVFTHILSKTDGDKLLKKV